MSARDRRKNRIFTDMGELRQAVNDLISQGRYRVIVHAKEAHPEFDEVDRVHVVRWGTRDRPDEKKAPSEGVYLCWLRHPRFGMCRGVYAIEETPAGDILVIITVMRE
jgi:hypothetical protein